MTFGATWQGIRRWWPVGAILGVGLFVVLGDSRFGADGNHVVRALFLAAASATVAVSCFRAAASGTREAARAAVLVSCLIAAVLGAVVSQQTICVRGTGGSEPECDESAPLSRAAARDNTEAGLIIVIGLGGVAIVSALAGLADSHGRLA